MQPTQFDNFTRSLSTPVNRRALFTATAVAIAVWLKSFQTTRGQLDCGFSKELCHGQCVDPFQDRYNCGGCGRICPGGQACSYGQCGCPMNYQSCGNQCVDLFNDPYNCGKCGSVCHHGTICKGMVCRCPGNAWTCGDQCVDVFSDPFNCGKCGAVCPPNMVCSHGICQAVSSPSLPPTDSPGSDEIFYPDPQYWGIGTVPPSCLSASQLDAALPNRYIGTFGEYVRMDPTLEPTDSDSLAEAVYLYSFHTNDSRMVAVVAAIVLKLGVQPRQAVRNYLDRDTEGALTIVRHLALEPSQDMSYVLFTWDAGSPISETQVFYWGHRNADAIYLISATTIEDVEGLVRSILTYMNSERGCAPGRIEQFPG